MQNDVCDYCTNFRGSVGPIRRLNTGGGSGVYLCRQCWNKEMKWRKQRNKTLSRTARFPILKFPTNKRGPSYHKLVNMVSEGLRARAARRSK